MSEYVSGNIFIRTSEGLPKGGATETHAHDFDHTTFCLRGGFKVEKLDGENGNVTATTDVHAHAARSWVLIEKDTWHRLTALDEGSLYACVYAHRNTQGEVVQEWAGWADANG